MFGYLSEGFHLHKTCVVPAHFHHIFILSLPSLYLFAYVRVLLIKLSRVVHLVW